MTSTNKVTLITIWVNVEWMLYFGHSWQKRTPALYSFVSHTHAIPPIFFFFFFYTRRMALTTKGNSNRRVGAKCNCSRNHKSWKPVNPKHLVMCNKNGTHLTPCHHRILCHPGKVNTRMLLHWMTPVDRWGGGEGVRPQKTKYTSIVSEDMPSQKKINK